MKLVIENTYSDGHACSSTVPFDEYEPAPDDEDEMEEFWEDIFELTGCRCREGGHPEGDSYYTATISEARNAALVGKSGEWG